MDIKKLIPQRSPIMMVDELLCVNGDEATCQLSAGATEPPVGYIGEVKNFHLYNRPKVGDVLTTTITMGPEVEGITIIRGETKVNDEVYADTTMKIFVKE